MESDLSQANFTNKRGRKNAFGKIYALGENFVLHCGCSLLLKAILQLSSI